MEAGRPDRSFLQPSGREMTEPTCGSGGHEILGTHLGGRIGVLAEIGDTSGRENQSSCRWMCGGEDKRDSQDNS